MGLPRFPDVRRAPRQWRRDMLTIDTYVRRFERSGLVNDLAKIILGAMGARAAG